MLASVSANLNSHLLTRFLTYKHRINLNNYQPPVLYGINYQNKRTRLSTNIGYGTTIQTTLHPYEISRSTIYEVATFALVEKN